MQSGTSNLEAIYVSELAKATRGIASTPEGRWKELRSFRSPPIICVWH